MLGDPLLLHLASTRASAVPGRPATMEGPKSSTMRTAALIGVYLASNIAMNLLNRWMLGLYPFPFPIFMTACHMLFTFLTFFPFLTTSKEQRQEHLASFSKQGGGLLAIGLTFAANIALNNFSLVALPLSMNQIIRSSMPVVVALMAVVLEGRCPTRMELASLTILCIGVATTVTHHDESTASMNGILICGLSVVACAVMMCTSGRVMREKVRSVCVAEGCSSKSHNQKGAQTAMTEASHQGPPRCYLPCCILTSLV